MNLPTLHIARVPNSRRSIPRQVGNNGIPTGVGTGGSAFMIRTDYPGLDGVLDEMRRLVTQFKGHPEIRDRAVAITAGIPRDIRTKLPNRRNFQNIASAVYDWMKKNIQYVRDPAGIEWLQTPIKTLEIGYGDCDDQSILAGALLSSIGVSTRFKVVKADAAKPNSYSHVYLEYKADGAWKAFDPTLHSAAGDGLSDSQIYGSRTVPLSDGLAGCGCGCGGTCGDGLADGTKQTQWKVVGGVLLAGAFIFSYFNTNNK